MPKSKEPNRLTHEKSPYLLQHAHNPVDWFPWSSEAFDKAKQEGSLSSCLLGILAQVEIYLSLVPRNGTGSFGDREIADILNSNFVSIKVDREEHPDVDELYMHVCQIMTGSGDGL